MAAVEALLREFAERDRLAFEAWCWRLYLLRRKLRATQK